MRPLPAAAAALLLVLASGLARPAAAQIAANTAPEGGMVRVLDKVTGAVEDIALAPGVPVESGRLRLELGECRYPAGNPAGDAYALLTIHYRALSDPVFRGWMIASSPALNALDHPRYDVWLLRCRTS